MLEIIDTHCHLYSDKFDADRPEAIQRAIDLGVKKILLPNVDLTTVDGLHALMREYPHVCYGMMGLHPCDVKEDFDSVLDQMELLLSQNPYVAIGEIGIDLYWDKSTQDIQEKAFIRQVEWALQRNLPIAIHTRNATQLTIELLKPYKGKGLKGVFHCFSESYELATEILKLEGFYLGLGGVLTYKNNHNLREVMEKIPLEHVILETDSPYLPPEPNRGKRNEPAYTRLVAEKLAEVKNTTLGKVAEITTANAKSLFALDSIETFKAL